MKCSSTAARMSSARWSSAAASTSSSFTRSSAQALQRPDTSVGYRPAMRRGVVASTLTAVLALVALGLIGAAPAAASPAAQYGIQDDAWLMYGPGTLSTRVATLDRLGTRLVRFTLRWDQVAPTRPASPRDPADSAYRWGQFETVLRALHADGITTLVTLYGSPG